MKINTRFPMAIHAPALIAMNKNEDTPSTSQRIAQSVGTNPVVIRRILAPLKKNRLVHIQAGVAGTTLCKAPQKITFLEIYQAVKTEEDYIVFDLHQKPSPYCPIGKNIIASVKPPLQEAQKAMETALAEYTLADVIANIEKELQK